VGVTTAPITVLDFARRDGPIFTHGDEAGWADGNNRRRRETCDSQFRLGDLPAARTRTVVVLGNESYGIPPDALELLDLAVEIPMVGTGLSLNVAVAGSLVPYKLAGLL
jgi:tRNA (guanosine-2'-O-)-methyltransferase